MNVYWRALITLAFVTFLSWLTVSANRPTVWAPLSFFVLGATWVSERFLGRASPLAGLLFVPLFCTAWCLPVFKGKNTVPIRSFVLLVLAFALSLANLIFGYEYGIRWQGHSYVEGVIAISVVLWVAVGALAWTAWRRQTTNMNLVFHAAFFGWLAWYSLPTLGELP